MNFNRFRKTIAMIATTITFGLGAGAAQAAFTVVDLDPVDMSFGLTKLTLANVSWARDNASLRIQGRLNGVLKVEGAGECAKVLVQWRMSNLLVVNTDTSPEVCRGTISLAPIVGAAVSGDHDSPLLSKATVSLLVKDNGVYRVAASRTVAIGD